MLIIKINQHFIIWKNCPRIINVLDYSILHKFWNVINLKTNL